MPSFEELGVRPDLVEALAAEGIEEPTAFQEAVLPVLLRETSLVSRAGPGAGTLLAYGLPLLQGIREGVSGPQAIVLAPTTEAASRLASSLARIAEAGPATVAALEAHWALPERATILFAAPEDLLRAVQRSQVSLESAGVLVIDGYAALSPRSLEALDALMPAFPRGGQRILLSQPLTEEAEAFASAHIPKGVHVPPRSATEPGRDTSAPTRGDVAYRITGETKEPELLRAVDEFLSHGAEHVLLFFNTEDQAADFADFLALHGFLSGAPGQREFPLWLATDALPARQAVEESDEVEAIATVSVDVPPCADTLDRRHGRGGQALILVRSRELPHLRDVARLGGYRLVPASEPPPTRVAGELERLRELLVRTLERENLAPQYVALESLFRDYAPAEVAAAALALYQARAAVAKGRGQGAAPEGGEARESGPRAAGPGKVPKSWVRLFVGVGEKDGVGPGDLLGAITGEAGLEGAQVGKIEIRETFSLVEVSAETADRVIRSVNGTTIRGRSVRVDYDRGGARSAGRSGTRSRPPRRSGP